VAASGSSHKTSDSIPEDIRSHIPKKESVHRVYAHRMDPREHPDYDRRPTKPLLWETIGNRVQFTSLRGFEVQDGRVVDFEKTLDRSTREHDLGNVIWPSYPILFTENLEELSLAIDRRGLFLFDIWGYVPGSGPGGYWQQFKPPPGVFDLLESKLGDRWLGMDVGEQDGRYIGRYAPQMVPASADRFEQYLNFQRHFEYLCNELGNKMCALVSLNFGHYLLKEGSFTTIGAETAQALPNAQVFYCFVRGAGKQYGVPWFGNASVWNRWGYKSYNGEGSDPDHGPTKGTSLSLLKRLLYSHILYDCVFAGFESGWFSNDGLSPIGRIQEAAHKWVREADDPGVMLTPVAIVTDFFSGWTFPRHLYTRDLYRVWGNLPYEPGDYLTEGVLDILYPGYQDASYYHDESGFIVATPYGDIADCLLTDAPEWLLNRYAALVVTGEIRASEELRDRLLGYAEKGGHLVITAGNLARFSYGLAGITIEGPRVRFTIENPVVVEGRTPVMENVPFDLYPLSFPTYTRIVSRCGHIPTCIEIPFGAGKITVLASPFGIGAERTPGIPIASEVDQPLQDPYPLLNHVSLVLGSILGGQELFDVGDVLSLITCRKGKGEYTLGICNNSLLEQPFEIVSRCGPILSVTEIALDRAEKTAPGYLPEGCEKADVGTRGPGKIAGGDIRLFSVSVNEEGVEEIPAVSPPSRPIGRVLPLRGKASLKEQVLSRPTFFEHFDGVSVDWRYLTERETQTLDHESGWIERQKLRVFVDLTSGLNLFPDLRLVDNLEEEYARSMEVVGDVLEKMEVLRARDLILSLHWGPENNMDATQTLDSFRQTLGNLCRDAGDRGITVYLRHCQKNRKSLRELAEFVEEIDVPNLRLAPSTALVLHEKEDIAQLMDVLGHRVGLWLASAPVYDISGTLFDVNAPLTAFGETEKLIGPIEVASNVPVLLDAVYEGPDEEYFDIRELERITTQSKSCEPAYPETQGKR